MRKLFMPLIAVLFLAACQTGPASDGSVSGRGASIGGDGVYSSTGPGSQQDLVENVGDRVFFALDSAELNSEARGILERQARWLKQYGKVTLVIEGHCDERGTREYNLALGERRANAVKNYLVALGVDSSRIEVISYGKERPEVVGSNDEAWAQNRRGVSVVKTN